MKFLRRAAHIVSLIALLALLIAFLSAESQPPTPGDPPQSAPATDLSRLSPDIRGTSQSPVIVSVAKGADEAAQDQRDRENESSAKWWTVGLTGLTLIVLIVQAVVLWQQNEIMKRQSRIMRGQRTAARIQAKRMRETTNKMGTIADAQANDVAKSIAESARAATAMERAAIAMEASAEAAKVSAGIAMTAIQHANRPWLSVKVEIITTPVKIRNGVMALRARVIVTNVGTGAAQHVRLAVEMLADEDGVTPMKEIKRVFDNLPASMGHVVLPTDQFVREFTLAVGPVEDSTRLRPTIIGGVRYTHGRATSGTSILPAPDDNTSFGFKVVPRGNIASHLIDGEDLNADVWLWDAEVVTSSCDFNYAQ